MVNNQEKIYDEWLKKAEEDEHSAEALVLDKKGSPSTVCFLSQQMVEKLLKALLIFHQKRFAKIHDLLKLEDLLLEVEPGIRKYERELDLLSTYYVETRYPGDYSEFTWKEAKEAFDAAVIIKKFVMIACKC